MPKTGMQEVRREQVIAATVRCIMNKGLSNLSMKDIAREAGVSTGVIYHYFENKSDLLLQVLKTTFQRSREDAVGAIAAVADPIEKLDRHVRAILRTPRDNPQFFSVFLCFLGESVHDPAVRDIMNRFLGNLKAYMASYLAQLPAEDADAARRDTLPTLVYALGMGLGVMWTLQPGVYAADTLEETVAALWTDYLKKD
ncbi:TetR family transcriptional regulator [Alicyclobacillus sp.]|uniref:TetR family transcriptional regulator n=1 Tax=Alicyclobacillus sp. TaxID=61169 RepID=UPI0025B9180D|nr:TetR family transcriptional regulator [Alicyclobacillus sp.]MCL6515326.1 TetR family transcriptional regulator [Alicyclobacillus sp.]